MTHQTETGRRRSGFTLIELMVVIAIIAILASLLLAAVMRALTVVKQVQNRNEIGQLAVSIANFKQYFGVDYLPSSFNPSSQASQFYWNQLFPFSPAPSTLGVPTMQGNQCLVFFLGGVNQQGFSSNPQNPMATPNSGEVRKGPFFSFTGTRLYTPSSGGSQGYLDIYNSPFAYFSTTGTIGSYTSTDCAGLVGYNTLYPSNTPAPYYYSAGNYINPNSFQIISAGADGVFGPGGTWPAALGRPGGYDDISNFATTILGSPNQ